MIVIYHFEAKNSKKFFGPNATSGECTMYNKVSEKTQNVPKKFCSLKSWFYGFIRDDIFWNFENWSTRTLRKWVSIYRQSQADCLYWYRQLLILFCLHLGAKKKHISAGFQWINFQNSKKCHLLWTHRTNFWVSKIFWRHFTNLTGTVVCGHNSW